MEAAIVMCRDPSNWFSPFRFGHISFLSGFLQMELGNQCFICGAVSNAFQLGESLLGGCASLLLKTLVCCSYKVSLHVILQVLCTLLHMQHGLKYELYHTYFVRTR